MARKCKKKKNIESYSKVLDTWNDPKPCLGLSPKKGFLGAFLKKVLIGPTPPLHRQQSVYGASRAAAVFAVFPDDILNGIQKGRKNTEHQYIYVIIL